MDQRFAQEWQGRAVWIWRSSLQSEGPQVWDVTLGDCKEAPYRFRPQILVYVELCRPRIAGRSRFAARKFVYRGAGFLSSCQGLSRF